MQVRRHHLIEEAKAEVDVVYEEVKRIEGQLISLEREFGQKIAETRRLNGAQMPGRVEALLAERDTQKASIDALTLYHLEKATLERFAVLTAAFSTVCVSADAEEAEQALGSVVFRPGEMDQLDDEVRTALGRFAHGLRAYTMEDSSSENDRTVRESWAMIEQRLRDFGRAI